MQFLFSNDWIKLWQLSSVQNMDANNYTNKILTYLWKLFYINIHRTREMETFPYPYNIIVENDKNLQGGMSGWSNTLSIEQL